MRYSKGKWKASYRDTWDITCSLEPIMVAWLTKFRDVYEEKEFTGVPSKYCYKMDMTKEEVNEAKAAFIEDLDFIIHYLDSSNDPELNILDYNMNIEISQGQTDPKTGCAQVNIVNHDEQASDRFNDDVRYFAEQKEKALKLFAEIYPGLWW